MSSTLISNRLAIILLTLAIITTLSIPTKSYSQTENSASLPMYLEALKHYHNGNNAEAYKLFKQITINDKSNDAAYYYLANLQLKQRDLDGAITSVNKALETDPSNNWYKQLLASLYTFAGKNNKAIEIYNQIRESEPTRSEFYDGLIELYIQEKEYGKAREILDEIEQSVGINEATGLTNFNLLIYEGKQEEAYSYLEEFDKNYGTPRTSTILGDYYAENQNTTSAQQFYMKALNMAPDYVPASFGLAEIYRIQGKYDLYFARMFPFMEDPNVDPFMKTSYMKQIMGNIRFVQTFLPQVDTMMQNMYKAHPRDSSVVYSYSLFLVQSDKSPQALEVLEQNLEFYPTSKEAHRQYLSLLYYLEMWDSLHQNSSKTLEIFPDNPDFLQFKAIAQLQNGNLQNSIATFHQILKHAQGDSTTIVNTLTTIGDLNYQAGNHKEAYKYYQKVIRKEPRHLPALNNYAYYISLEGKNLKKAYKMSKITIEAEPNNSTYLDTFAWILHLMGNNIEAKAVFKHAMLYGGKESADIMDHYAHVLYELKEYDLAFMYWSQADKLDPSKGIAQKAETLKANLPK
ncbi:MAG: tetratricopeptide repeat protein [Bacteroidales bacterium]